MEFETRLWKVYKWSITRYNGRGRIGKFISNLCLHLLARRRAINFKKWFEIKRFYLKYINRNQKTSTAI